MADVAEQAAAGRDHGDGQEQLALSLVGDYPKVPPAQIRRFVVRVFNAAIPAHLAAAEAYSACLAQWVGIGSLSLSKERIDSLAICAQRAASGGAVSCGYAEFAALGSPSRATESIPSAAQLDKILDQLGDSLVVVHTASNEQLGVVAPGGEFVIVLMSNLRLGQEVSLSSRGMERQSQSSRVAGVDLKSRIAVISPLPPNLMPVLVADPGSLVNGQPLVGLTWVSRQTSARLLAMANTEKTLARVLGKSECSTSFVEIISEASEPEVSGPVFDLRGRLVAFGSLYHRPPRGVPLYANFGYPASTVLQIAERLRRYGYWKRGRIGITMQEVTAELAAALGVPTPTGALVQSVEREGPADKAGLRPSDVILTINGQHLARSCQLVGQLEISLPGDLIRLKVWRNGKELEVNAVAGEVPAK